MSARPRLLLAPLLAGLLLVGPRIAGAAPDETSDSGLSLTLKNGQDADGKPQGAYFSAAGKTQPLLDGTVVYGAIQPPLLPARWTYTSHGFGKSSRKIPKGLNGS